MTASKRVTVEERERAIIRHLRSASAGSPVREIWERVSDELGDGVTQQAYYKVLDRLVADGKLDLVESVGDGSRRYQLTPHLHADTGVTLDDIYELVETLAPSDAIARVLDARDYFETHRTTTLRKAAKALLEEDPIDLISTMLEERLATLRADVEIYRHHELSEREVEARLDSQFRDLQTFVYRYLGLTQQAIAIAKTEEIKVGKLHVLFDMDRVREELKMRVFGERAIMPINISTERRDDSERLSVAGSNGSTHASVMQVATSSSYVDDVGHQVVTFNNSVAYVDAPAAQRTRNAVRFPYYSVPMTQTAIDDRSNRGMVIAPFMFRHLSEAEYEHMAKCATDVVQWRADAQVFLGTARSLQEGALLPRPMVHFRDGTITPQEREWNHYQRGNEYGDMVREGIAYSRRILEKLISSDSPPVFAGAVKSTQVRFFSTLLNWYISKGSRHRFGQPLDARWDTTRAAHIADNEAMTFLLSSLEPRPEEGVYYATFAVARPFHTLTEFYKTPKDTSHNWVAHFREMQARAQRNYDDGLDGQFPYLTAVPDIEDENFVFMCRKADYVSFYVGHSAGNPPPLAPRYEFMEGLRTLDDVGKARERVRRNVKLIIRALDRSKLSLDKQHSSLAQKVLAKVVPFVILEAQEKCKALGRKLEAELRSVVIANIQTLKQGKGPRPSDVQFLPMSARRFLERYARVLEEDRIRNPERDSR